MSNIRWRARYFDNTWLDQGKNTYENIDRKKLASFDILKDVEDQNAEYQLEQLLLRVWLEKGQKLIYRRRVTMDIMGDGQIKSELWLVGYQEKINGTNKQVINYIFPDGHVEQAGKWIGGLPEIKDYEVEI